MEKERNQKRWGVAAIVAIALLASVPQLCFIFDRGRAWNGANAITHTDEVAYSAYIASLIRDRPRRNDPFTGRQESAAAPAPESLFSIQMVPAYALATPARTFGLSASTLFIVAPFLCAIASAFVILWFVSNVTGDRRLGAVAVCFVLGFGTLLARQGMIRYTLTRPFLIPQWISDMIQSPSLFHLPFLRFYQPAVGFPLFFLLCAFVSIALTSSSKRKSFVAAALAACTFGVLVFTYFFLWTAAAAWLACVLALWLIARKEDRRRTLMVTATIVLTAVPVFVVYFRMLSHRASTVDTAQALVATHRPDLFRLPEVVAVGSLIVLLIGFFRGVFAGRDPRVLLVASLSLSIITVFNQQMITGKSLQPFHYEWFIANYCAGVALLLAVVFVTQHWWTNRRLLIVGCLALFWGIGEVWLAATLNRSHNDHIDDGRVVGKRLTELSYGDGTLQAEKGAGEFPVVLVSDLQIADRLPTDAPQVPLWAPHMLIFPGVTEAENRERFFKQLYYLGFDEKKIYKELDRNGWTFYAGFFPYYRLSPVTRGNASPITPEELRTHVQEYQNYSAAFTQEQAAHPRLQYLVVDREGEPNYENIDHWYERDRGEVIGRFVLYRLRIRQ
jgi:hypothetical protein